MTSFFETGRILDLWAAASARSVATPPAIEAYAEALGRSYGNGRVVAASFELELDAPVLHMAAHLDNWKDSLLLDLVWDVPGVRSALPPLESRSPSLPEYFERADVFELVALLSRRLHYGGAYFSSRGAQPTNRTFELGLACARTLAGSDPHFAGFVSHVAWSDFFFDVAWDLSVVALRSSDKRIDVILATDTGDLDVVGQLPVSRRLSLRLWLWGGLRWSEFHRAPSEVQGALDFASATDERTQISGGIAPELLLHVTSSVAFTFGSSVTLAYDLGEASTEFDFRAGPGMTYAFGPDESGERLEDARKFSERGRRVLSSGLSLDGDSVSATLSFARFVLPRLAVGGYLSGGSQERTRVILQPSGFDRRDTIRDSSFGGGAELMYDVPLPGSISLLAAPRVGYMWKASVNVYREYRQAAHELQIRVPVYIALHLHEALVIGAGPEFAADFRFAEPFSSPEPNANYVRVGASSTISASF